MGNNTLQIFRPTIAFRVLICLLISAASATCAKSASRWAEKEYGANYSLSILKDSTHHLTISDILQPEMQQQFEVVRERVPSYGTEDITYWLKLDLDLEDPLYHQYVVEVAYPTFDSILYFSKANDSAAFTARFEGDIVPYDHRKIDHKNFVFEVPDRQSSSQTVYLRIRSRGSKMFPIHVLPVQELYKQDITSELLYGIFYGIMLVMFLYNLFLSYSSRNISYLFYVLIIAGNILALSALNGHAFKYLWSNNPWWGNHVVLVGMGLWVFSSNVFANSFLDTKKYSPVFSAIFKIMQIVGVATLFMGLVLPYDIGLFVANISVLLNCSILFTSGLLFWIKGIRIARIFSLAWSTYLIGVIIYLLRSMGIFPVNFFTTHGLEVGAVMEVILLSLALGYKYRILEDDKKRAQNNALAVMTNSQLMVQKQNEDLEERIKERTLELQQKQEEVIAQNEELNEKNNELTMAQMIIKDQNKKLKNYSDNLKKEVEDRTLELRVSNRELAQNLQKLEQYAFMTAHNLRGPVARLLGLIYLLEIEPTLNTNNQVRELMGRIQKESANLDAVIKDMNTIIELRKKSDVEIERVDIRERLEHVQVILESNIEETEATISTHLEEFDHLETNPTFLESILYNLISNAIKYRHPGRNPHLIIRTEEIEGYNLIHVEDNGVGIDMVKFGNELFSMFKRFHVHVEGKGLGLFLVKSQIDILGGKVTVNSKVNEGTTFTLYFPAENPQDKIKPGVF